MRRRARLIRMDHCGEGPRFSFAVALGVRVRLGALSAAGKCQPQNRSMHGGPLLPKGAGVVRQAVSLTDLANPRGDLAVARTRHVGEKMMLDLVAQVAT